MDRINRNFIFVVFILITLLIFGCGVKVSQPPPPTTPTPLSQEQAPVQPEQKTTQITPPETKQTSPPPTSTTIQTTDITSVKCDGQAYNLLVKPNHLIMWIMLESENKPKIAELKSEGLIEEFVEVINNDGTAAMPTKQSYKGMSAEIISSRGSGEISILSGWIFAVTNLKVDNADKVRERIQALKQIKVGSGYSGYGMGDIWGNSGDKDIIFEFKCRIATGPGRIVVYSNIAEASFTATGPKSYNGKGACFQAFDAPPGEYTFIFNDVAGYTSPTKMLSSGLKLTLVPEGQLNFGAAYTQSSPASTGTIIVITNLPEAKFTITGPAAYSGSGTCWGQANVPTGQYQVEFQDVSGYELSYFDKKKSIYVSSGFGMQTAEAEYKKIGE